MPAETTSDGAGLSEWDPEPSVQGRHYVASDFSAELERHLPSGWEVTKFDLWGPKEVNHGGGAGYDVRVEHDDGATVRLKPASTFPGDHGQTTYNSHRVKRELSDGNSTVVADARKMVRRDEPAEVLKTVVEAAEDFSGRYDLWH